MSAAELLNTLNQQEVIVRLRGSDLELDAPQGTITPELLALIRQSKSALIQLMASEEDVLEAMVEAEEERAAVMEYDGGFPRREAEEQARMQAYDYLLDDGGGWCVMIAGYKDLTRAREALEWQYGKDRVLALEFHKPRI
ncbi:hypothetical protein [Nitrosococcus wardiae]|uniref:TubC N-terminal docking domain-containing protein n=1 Tax=Nitrosococcus wardiae TaxID=1814290 RepID=A0A4P7BW04_9GAMM|nr:hypothetical protein [Nitrosococcus wardiae]QBQ53369.1 hypothetical protein E3U44_01740 [Nitrosococcus wardiae]